MALHPLVLYRLDVVSQIDWSLYSFELPLVSGNHRKGLVIQLGEEGWGEVSPLPGRSEETLDQALEQLLSFFHTGKTTPPFFPSVQFGLESALSPLESITVPVYALLQGSPTEVLKQAEEAAKKGHTTVKLKVAKWNREEIHSVIGDLLRRFRLRVDCNLAFSFEEACALFSGFARESFDYIEDPTYETEKLSQFPYPFALDEKLFLFSSVPSYLRALVLKPTLLGGGQGCAPWITWAKKHNLTITLSSSFESSLGLSHIARLAHEEGLASFLLGIDTQRFLKRDLFSLDFSSPSVKIRKSPIDQNQLKKIVHGTCEMSHFSAGAFTSRSCRSSL